MRNQLNKGNPIICNIEYSDTITSKDSYFGYFNSTNKISNTKIFPKVSADAVITKPSYSKNDNSLKNEMITIAGYSDDIDDGNNTGVFKIVTSYGSKSGIKGCGFISYDCFFTAKSNNGIIRTIVSIG